MKFWTGIGLGLAASVCAAQAKPSQAKQQQNWVASWATSMQAPEPENNQPGLAKEKLTDATVREIVRLSVGGVGVRVHFSNAHGTQPLVIDDAHIAFAASPASSSIVEDSDRNLSFDGHVAVTIPIGAEMISDLVYLQPKALSDVAISYHLPQAPVGETCHPGSHANEYIAPGSHGGDTDLAGAKKTIRWEQVAEVDVLGPDAKEAVVTFGDSITDGHGSTTDGNDRWPDVLAARLHAAGMKIGVANEGIGGNHLLTNGLGENALQRFDRDVLAVSGVKTVVVFEGINDIGMLARGAKATPEQHAELRRRMIAAYEQIVLRAHAHGLRVIGVTMTPFTGSDYYFPTPENEADRVAVNAWIREPGHFDAVVDFDKVVCDPADPSHMLKQYDSGDHLHPGPEGYKAMAAAFPLDLLK